MSVMGIVSGVDLNGVSMDVFLLTRAIARTGNKVVPACRRASWICRELPGTSNVAVHEYELYKCRVQSREKLQVWCRHNTLKTFTCRGR